jgi:uncharacterized 2Fe-2S/4Fe-4S cluster protein (DUF4445 family)
VPPESQVHRQVIRKAADLRPIALDPVVHLHYVEVAEPDMHDPASDFRRLSAALRDQWQVDGVRAALPVLRTLQKALRCRRLEGHRRASRGPRHRRRLAGPRRPCFGVAVDIGSTTDRRAPLRPDHRRGAGLGRRDEPADPFGEDLMSRVSYVMMNPGGDREMTDAVRDGARPPDRRGRRATPGSTATDILEVTSSATRSCTTCSSASTRPSSAGARSP